MPVSYTHLLAEYARKPEFGNLKELMDIFYREAYTVWQGEVERNRLKADAEQTFALLKQRPGMFARSLFANMLWFGAEAVSYTHLLTVSVKSRRQRYYFSILLVSLFQNFI